MEKGRIVITTINILYLKLQILFLNILSPSSTHGSSSSPFVRYHPFSLVMKVRIYSLYLVLYPIHLIFSLGFPQAWHNADLFVITDVQAGI